MAVSASGVAFAAIVVAAVAVSAAADVVEAVVGAMLAADAACCLHRRSFLCIAINIFD